MGLLGGLFITSMLTRTMLAPITIYSQLVGYKMKLMKPDMDDLQAKYKRYSQQG
jgi:membrane protein insertase Oxa1/YidC/SpoIIIJ